LRVLLEAIWSNWRIGLMIAALAAAAIGLLSAWLTPRGPVTTAQALVAMAMALALGLLVGLVTGSRWSMLVAPLAFVAAFELARLGVRGPTVDAIHLRSTYGIIAFVVGRLMHAILVLPPMLLGIVYGISAAVLLGSTAAPVRPSGWILTGLFTLAMFALAYSIARPAITHPIVGLDGAPLPGSVAELIQVPIGGHNQALMIRGRSTDNPVLLFLAGGPGGTEMGAMRADTGLEQDFVVVTWDQRGAGKSYAALDPVDTLTLEQAVADTIELTDYLRARFGQDKIFLVGQSWGTTLGVLVVQQRPDLYHAFVGAGQMVSQRETDIMHYEDTLAWAERTGNATLIAALRQSGPPPYDDLLNYEPALAHEHDWNPYPTLDVSKEMPAILFVPEYSLMDKINGLRAFLDTFSVLYPQLQGIDFRDDVPSLDVPAYMLIGEHETRGRATLANEWFDLLDAPLKERVVFEGAGHRPNFEQPGLFAELMRDVLAVTFPDH